MKFRNFGFLAGMVFLWCITAYSQAATRETTITSPDGNLSVTLSAGTDLNISVVHSGKSVLKVQQCNLVVNGSTLANGIGSISIKKIHEVQHPVIREKRAVVADNCNEATIRFRSEGGIVIRVYNDGFAYRFFTRFKEDTVIVDRESARLTFSPGDSVCLPLIRCRTEAGVDCYHTSFEEDFVFREPGKVTSGEMAYLPVYARTSGNFSIAVAESDLYDYPGMFLRGVTGQDHRLEACFSPYPLEVKVYGDLYKQELVTRRASYIARTAGNRDYPWRAFIIGTSDGDLVNSDMVYRLAPACRLEDTGWIRAGKITDEWIINSILYGVDFKTGINTATYKYYIDFAHRFGLEYIFLDAGWSDTDDFGKLNPEVDLPEIIRYGKEKGVGIWLWTCALTTKRQLDYLPKFAAWGVKGIMVDFMDREDQLMIRFQEQMAEATARNRLMLLFHGASKPAGLRKMYPNVINREGVMGHEYDKWSERLTPEHNLIIPFTRMIAGPLDYEGGGMLNAQKNAFRMVDPAPMTQGTRIHQLAMYVVYESPLMYLAGNISDYLREPEYAAFFSGIPVEWDETRVLDGKISDFIIVARRSGNDWWVGAMTDWTPRKLEIDLSFLGTGTFEAEIYRDGINADVYAADYKSEKTEVDANGRITLNLAPGGGWVGRFRIRN
jgi:alpha-glucosidase